MGRTRSRAPRQSRAQQVRAVRAGELRTQARKSRSTEETVPTEETVSLRVECGADAAVAGPHTCAGGAGGVGVSRSCDGGGDGVGGPCAGAAVAGPHARAPAA